MRFKRHRDFIVHQTEVAIATAIAILGMEGARRATGVPSIAKNKLSLLMNNLHKFCLSVYTFCHLSKNKGETWEDDYNVR